MSDIGPTESGRWHRWQERCRMGAMSFVKVTFFGALGPAASAEVAAADNPIAQIVAARANLTAVDIETS
jgi:hypothetical protein